MKAPGYPFRRSSVRLRISAIAVLAVALALFAGSAALETLLRARLVRSLDTEAQVRAAEISALSFKQNLPSPAPSVGGDWPTLIQLVGPDGKVITQSAALGNAAALLDAKQIQSNRATTAKLQTPSVTQNRSGSWWVKGEPIGVRGVAGPVYLIVAISLSQASRSVEVLRSLLLIGVPLLAGGAGLASWILVGSALRPVEEIRRSALQLASGPAIATGQRVAVAGGDDELSALAKTFNLVIDRLEHSAKQQRVFVADASHELRSPVSNIRVALEVALAHPESADWPEVAQEVLQQDLRMGRLIEDLLALARGDNDPMRKAVEQVELSGLIRDLVAEANATKTRMVAISALPASPVVVADDPSQLRSLIGNLVENAVRFANSEVVVTLIHAGKWCEICVKDDGPGVPKAERNRVFDRFVRLDDHRSSSEGGSGLGLAIVKQLVAARNGTVGVSENPSGGANFIVRLPIEG